MEAVLRLYSDGELTQKQSTCKHLFSSSIVSLLTYFFFFFKWLLGPVDVCRCGPGVFAYMCAVSECRGMWLNVTR